MAPLSIHLIFLQRRFEPLTCSVFWFSGARLVEARNYIVLRQSSVSKSTLLRDFSPHFLLTILTNLQARFEKNSRKEK
jgi:hypothetical protein